MSHTTPCARCGGTGTVDYHHDMDRAAGIGDGNDCRTCPACDGEGVFPPSRQHKPRWPRRTPAPAAPPPGPTVAEVESGPYRAVPAEGDYEPYVTGPGLEWYLLDPGSDGSDLAALLNLAHALGRLAERDALRRGAQNAD